ncbi:hypothetical protein ACNRWW_11170 [Metabacillus sp. HB246100]|uniref:hypothetical protein n=1 Tax=Bacillus weihaiensis TaxID=1547283 RepID=UPI002357445B|nr:hypothetical protein [Bacillus weihaiensis]
MKIKVVNQFYNLDKESYTLHLNRESVTISPNQTSIVAHNYVCINPSFIPKSVYYTMIQKQSGIGHYLREKQLKADRVITEYGFINTSSIPYQHKLRITGELIPYKRYQLTFLGYSQPGFNITEYFHPNLCK